MPTFDSGLRTIGTMRRATGLRSQPLFSPDDAGGVTPVTPATPADPATPATPAADTPAISTAELEQLRTELQSLKDAEQARKDAALTEQQKLEQRATKAEQTARSLRAERTIEQEAAAQGLDPALALELLPADKLEFGEDGQPKNVKARLQALVSKFPALSGAASASTTSPTNPQRKTTTLTRADVQKMTPAEINARWDEVQQVLAS